eukprot:CAMPEP_0173408882 /NCGR_PEP_ID=MMETSP1356-20130122/70840_1 /TAXON_ID=77927 ORGANISM="Hemiselmis virescens, Strain PCC157" /NCGR_SAMPLE_ID=MMETSP1356 /ASSEMBLY_ACC=CAM_ASM_000847 /LENGTH=159 /DNA_ID=CAMNT_0014370253 /DNA_START=13 /DNA_END=489 /DNA_ORIENTATION=+
MARAVKEAKLKQGCPSNREMLMGCLRMAEATGLIQRRPQPIDQPDATTTMIDIYKRDDFLRLLAMGYYENNPKNKKTPQDEYVRDIIYGMNGRLTTQTNSHRKHQPLETFKAALKRCGIVPNSTRYNRAADIDLAWVVPTWSSTSVSPGHKWNKDNPLY